MSATSPHPTDAVRPAPRLLIDLDALQGNYRELVRLAEGGKSGAVVKADGYGLGARRIVPALWRAGCRQFYVAHAFEGETARAALDDNPADIFVFNGYWASEAGMMREHELTPVINDLAQLDALRATAPDLPFAIMFDTGMNRLGLDRRETEMLLADPSRLDGLRLKQVMSHLACADEADNPLNRAQLDAFARIRAAFPNVEASFANSAGTMLDRAYHFDVLRPGLALCGANATPGRPHPFTPVATIEAPILQIRRLEAGDTVGYGSEFIADRPRIAATVAAGYADGILRACGDGGYGRIGEVKTPILGRISMDLITVDVTDIADTLAPGDAVRFLGPDIDAMADTAHAIPFELLVRLGLRFDRRYIGGES